MRRRKVSTLSFAEKDFYLDEFHEKSLLFVIRAADLASETDVTAALEVFETLLKNETQLLFLIEADDTDSEQRRARALYKHLARAAKVTSPSLIVLPPDGTDDDLLLPIWTILRGSEVCVSLWPAGATVPLVTAAQRVAVNLTSIQSGVYRPSWGLSTERKISLVHERRCVAGAARPGEAEWAGLESRRPLLEAIYSVLEGGISSVTLCPLAGLGRELFTYEGDGTLFTLQTIVRWKN